MSYQLIIALATFFYLPVSGEVDSAKSFSREQMTQTPAFKSPEEIEGLKKQAGNLIIKNIHKAWDASTKKMHN